MLNIDPQKYYTRREVAEMRFRSFDALAADACKGSGIPFYKIGSRVLYLGQDILQFLDGNRVETENV